METNETKIIKKYQIIIKSKKWYRVPTIQIREKSFIGTLKIATIFPYDNTYSINANVDFLSKEDLKFIEKLMRNVNVN